MVTREPPVSERVVQQVAARSGTDPMELPRLYDAIDPDALDAVLADLPAGEVRFRYAGYTVSVENGGDVRLDERLTAGASQEE